MAGGDEGGLDCPVGGGTRIGHLVHNQRIVSAHFQGENLFRVIDDRMIQGDAGFVAACEKEAVDVGVVGEEGTGGAAALEGRDGASG